MIADFSPESPPTLTHSLKPDSFARKLLHNVQSYFFSLNTSSYVATALIKNNLTLRILKRLEDGSDFLKKSDTLNRRKTRCVVTYAERSSWGTWEEVVCGQQPTGARCFTPWGPGTTSARHPSASSGVCFSLGDAGNGARVLPDPRRPASAI